MNRLVNILIIAILLCGSAFGAAPTHTAYAQPTATGEFCNSVMLPQWKALLNIELNPGGYLEVAGLGARIIGVTQTRGVQYSTKITGDIKIYWNERAQTDLQLLMGPATTNTIDVVTGSVNLNVCNPSFPVPAGCTMLSMAASGDIYNRTYPIGHTLYGWNGPIKIGVPSSLGILGNLPWTYYGSYPYAAGWASDGQPKTVMRAHATNEASVLECGFSPPTPTNTPVPVPVGCTVQAIDPYPTSTQVTFTGPSQIYAWGGAVQWESEGPGMGGWVPLPSYGGGGTSVQGGFTEAFRAASVSPHADVLVCVVATATVTATATGGGGTGTYCYDYDFSQSDHGWTGVRGRYSAGAWRSNFVGWLNVTEIRISTAITPITATSVLVEMTANNAGELYLYANNFGASADVTALKSKLYLKALSVSFRELQHFKELAGIQVCA